MLNLIDINPLLHPGLKTPVSNLTGYFDPMHLNLFIMTVKDAWLYYPQDSTGPGKLVDF
jgi:hypothetical protein